MSMGNSRWIDKEVEGVVFKNSSAILLARIVDASGLPVEQSSVSTITYSIYQLDEANPDSLTSVSGHVGAAVSVAGAIYDSLQLDALWSVDSEGYNFRHGLDVQSNPAFPIAGASYQVRYEITPVSGQSIVVRFKLKAI